MQTVGDDLYFGIRNMVDELKQNKEFLDMTTIYPLIHSEMYGCNIKNIRNKDLKNRILKYSKNSKAKICKVDIIWSPHTYKIKLFKNIRKFIQMIFDYMDNNNLFFFFEISKERSTNEEICFSFYDIKSIY